MKYIKVDWPEYQDFMDYPKFREECYFCSDSNSYFIPEDLYGQIAYKLDFPAKYENTAIGTIVCYETRAIVNGKDIYWYDIDDCIKKGSEVLVYNHDAEDRPEWIITKCKLCSVGFPIILEDDKLIDGINCEIIGVKIDE